MSNLKLITEEPSFDVEILEEKSTIEGAQSDLYIKGPYLMAEQKNRNGRIYSLSEMVDDVVRYNSEMITERRSIGELNHPSSVEVNPERACHMITELKQEGNMFIGKSKILSSPVGQIVRCLITDGVKLGVSSRALGKLLPGNSGNAVKGFRLLCCDVVHDPSVSDAFVDGILESKEFILEKDGTICEAYEAFENTLEVLPNVGKEDYLKLAVSVFINSLGKNDK